MLLFAPSKTAKTYKAELERLELCFSPSGNCEDMVLNAFDGAKNSIDAAIYTFTSARIADALIKAKKNGVKVRLIVDGELGLERHAKASLLKRNGIEVRYENNPGGIMHNKYAIVDDHLVITGSYNWTDAANYSNYENLIFIYSKEAARKFKNDFETMWEKFR